jgi:hypothetical protein
MPRCQCEFDTPAEFRERTGGGAEAHARAHRRHHTWWETEGDGRPTSLPEVDFDRQVIGRLEFRIARLEETIERLLGVRLPPTCEAEALVRSSVPEVSRG